jgi:putative SOS response-associated peptidase YedK
MDWEDADAFEPRHNIAPRSRGVVIRRRRAGGTQHAQDAQGEQAPQDSELVMQTMRWGLIPHWSKHEDQSLSTTNARAEGLAAGGGMWAPLRGTKRCVVVCQG